MVFPSAGWEHFIVTCKSLHKNSEDRLAWCYREREKETSTRAPGSRLLSFMAFRIDSLLRLPPPPLPGTSIS